MASAAPEGAASHAGYQPGCRESSAARWIAATTSLRHAPVSTISPSSPAAFSDGIESKALAVGYTVVWRQPGRPGA